MNKIQEFLKSDSLWIQIIATLIVTAIIGIITLIFGLLKGLNINESLNWIVTLLNSKVNFYWYIILLIVIGFVILRCYKYIINSYSRRAYSKDEIDSKIENLNKKFENKLDVSTFERFSNVYDYRRLKNHPWHEQYSDNDVNSFIEMIKKGNNNSDKYDLKNGMAGLALELKERGWIHSSEKNDIKSEIKNCFTEDLIHEKEILTKVVDSTRVL